jgi:hypothetical protein
MAILLKAMYVNVIHIQIPMIWFSLIFITEIKNSPKVHLETQKTVNSQRNTQQKEQCWRYHNTRLQTILQSHSNKNSIVLAQKQIWRPMEQNRGPDMNPRNYVTPRNKLNTGYKWPLKGELQIIEERDQRRQPLQQMLLGKVTICLRKTETWSKPVTLY